MLQSTHSCDGLYTEHERIRRQIARVGQGVLLPQLGKEIL